ncbi:hypothetical protein OG568_08575 [Streptomyces sp. NBC_01450]|uniref:hypothetical protein n=1 Tax=Streptomyces sp. NBC_01450 TaxID=2903871 RepID=UPI002E2F614F|nr:hypothetical protein [Streptomyces sp. NBC_01450]
MLVAATADTPLLLWTGLAGGLAVAVAPWIAGRSVPAAVAASLLGALPYAVITWWTAVTPLTATLALLAGTVAIRRHRPSPGTRTLG